MQKVIHRKWSSFVRMTYDPNKKLSEGYFVNNILHSYDGIKSIESQLNNYFGTAKSYNSPSCIVYKGLPLADLEAEAKKIYKFMLYIVGLRVSKLTLDFMRDEKGIIWLLNLKSYELNPDSYEL